MNYMTRFWSILAVTLNLNFIVSSLICYISAKNASTASKRKSNLQIELLASNVTMGFDLGHDREIKFSKSNIQLAISQHKMPIATKQKMNIPHLTINLNSDIQDQNLEKLP